jgi:hypothetical protein
VSQDRAERFEIFVTWYLRFNGYFTVPNFVVHAGDDPKRMSSVTEQRLTPLQSGCLNRVKDRGRNSRLTKLSSTELRVALT